MSKIENEEIKTIVEKFCDIQDAVAITAFGVLDEKYVPLILRRGG